MKRLIDRLGWGLAGALGIAVVAVLGGVVSAGPLTPPGPPAATQETLIYQPASCADFPILIGTGTGKVYKLAERIDMPVGCNKDGIDISVGTVLDLNGFALVGQDSLGTDQDGIQAGGGGPTLSSGIVIKNGTIVGWDGAGINGSFASGIIIENVSVEQNGGGGIRANHSGQISNCYARANTGIGITVDAGSIVENCVSSFNSLEGIILTDAGASLATGGLVTNCTVTGNGSSGIALVSPGAMVSDCTVSDNSGHGIFLDNDTTVRDNDVFSNTLNGIHASSTSNRIEGNHLTGNAGAGVFVPVGVFDNTIIRNTADLNGGLAFSVLGGGNMVGTVVATEAAMNAAPNDLVNVDVP